MNPKRVEQSKEAYKRAEKIAKQSEYNDKTVASNGKITLNDCIAYFQKHSTATQKLLVATDPKVTRIFFPSGKIIEV